MPLSGRVRCFAAIFTLQTLACYFALLFSRQINILPVPCVFLLGQYFQKKTKGTDFRLYKYPWSLGKMQKQEFLYKGPNHAANLNSMRFEEKWCDVTIQVNGREIRAHKVILAANLKYFATMLSNDSYQESKEGVIIMESVEETDMEAFVSYAYTGEILLTESNALNLLELANYLSEDGIKKACVEFLDQHLKADEACRAYKFSNSIECLSLKNAAKAKILTNFEECSRSADYLNLDSESLMGILLDGKAQSVQLQQMLFEGIVRWIVHDAKDRKVCMQDLLSSIDVAKLNSDDVMSCLYKNLAQCDDEYGITKDIIFFCVSGKIERKEQEQVLMLISVTGSVQFYNFIERKWFQQQEIPNAAFKRCEPYSRAVLNDQLYYISTNSSGENCLQAFDPSSKQITSLHSSSSILRCAALSACNGFIYICGGVEKDNSRSDQILRYDPQTNSFETLASMGKGRQNAAAIFYQGCLHVLGGYDGSSNLQSVEKYDPVRNEWTVLASMCVNRWGHEVATLGGKLYACGGYSDRSVESSVEVYDPVTNSWQLVANMNKTRLYFILVAHKDKLLAIGGIGGEKTVETYDPSKDQWQLDQDITPGLQVDYCVGGLISSGSITSTQ